MKTVFKSSELPHIFIHERAPQGRCSSAMSFHGGAFKSYNATIATIQRTPLGEKVVFLNTSRYSNTTSSHQSAIRRAIPGTIKTCQVDGPFIDTPIQLIMGCIEYATLALQRAASVRLAYPKRKKPVEDLELAAWEHIETAKEVQSLFSVHEVTIPSDLDALRTRAGEIAAQRKAEDEARAERARLHELQMREEFPAKLAEWRTGERQWFPHDGSDDKAYFRLSSDGENVESSKGVFVPRDEARTALAFILSKRKDGWRKDGEKYPIAGYELDSIGEVGIVAGCHRFNWDEVEYVRSLI